MNGTQNLTDLDVALAHIAGDEAAIVADLARMIACDTSFPPGAGYGGFADLMETLLAPLGFGFRRVEVPESLWATGDGRSHGARVNLIAGRRQGRPQGSPVCSIYFHVDTVPAGPDWTRPPFALTRDGNRVYGRGTADMKGAVASVLAALRAAEVSALPLAFDPVLLFCTDEEGGLYPGVRYLADEGLLEGHLMCLNGGAAARIWAGCFGSIDLRIRVLGRSAHSGDPVGGVNAIEESLALMQALAELKRKVETRASDLPPPPHHEGKPLCARLAITAARGGDKGSSLPGRFDLVVNRRYGPEEEEQTVLAELHDTVETALASTRALGFEIETVGHLPPVRDPTGPHWPRWQRALGEGFGFAPEAFRRTGSGTSSDMGWVQRAGVQEILLGGLSRPEARVHGADEFTTVDDLVALARSVLLYLSRDFKPNDNPDVHEPT